MPWLVVLVHSPCYNSNNFHYTEGEPMRVQFEQCAVDAMNDLVFAGHVHAYERGHRMSNVRYNITNGRCASVRHEGAPRARAHHHWRRQQHRGCRQQHDRAAAELLLGVPSLLTGSINFWFESAILRNTPPLQSCPGQHSQSCANLHTPSEEHLQRPQPNGLCFPDGIP